MSDAAVEVIGHVVSNEFKRRRGDLRCQRDSHIPRGEFCVRCGAAVGQSVPAAATAPAAATERPLIDVCTPTASTRRPLASEVSTMMIAVHCTGRRKSGALCDQRLLYVDLDLLERRVLAGKQQISCPRCGKIEDFGRWG